MRLSPLLLLLAACPESQPKETGAPPDTGTPPDSADDSGETALPNEAPSTPVVSITPAQPNGASKLEVQFDTPSVDPNGDPVVYAYVWTKNGTVVEGAATESITPDLTEDGETWAVSVTASDAEFTSAPATASVLLANLAPTAPTIRIDPAAPNGGDTLTLVFDASSADPNGDVLTQTIVWYFDGVRNSSFDGRTSVDGVYVDGGETFLAEVTVTDGMSDPVVTTASVSVPNTAPTVTSVSISPTDPLDGDDLECNARADDADGSDPVLSYRWYRDGVEAPEVGVSETVLADFTIVGESWECEVTASDGFASATMLSSAVTIRAPSGYRVTSSVEVTVTADTAGTDAAEGYAEWDVYSGGGRYATNDCTIYWSLVATEDASICRGCIYSFAAEYTYDASRSSVTTGCATLPADSGGDLTFENRRALTMTATLDDVYYSLGAYYYGTNLRFNETGTGGYGTSYSGYSRGSSYEVVETLDAYGRTVLTGYSMNYFYY